MIPILRNRLEKPRVKIFRIFERELKNGRRRLNFSAIAREIGVSRQTVVYHYNALRKDGLIGVDNGRMYLIRKRFKTNGSKPY